MTLEEYTAKLGTLAQAYTDKAVDGIFVPAANELLATIKNRISQEGKNTADGKIGQYDTTPAYYGQQAFVRKSSFQAVGKTGERVFKNGKPHKTEYIPSGYKGLREKQGRRTDVMNMSYSGSLLLAYQMQAQDRYVLIGFTNTEASDIRKGQEKKRGKIFYGTNSELETYNNNVREESEKLVRSIL